MSSPSKGGRGKQAPYFTTHCRIPERIKSTVESLAAAYKILANDRDLEGISNLLKSTNEAISNLGEREAEVNRLKLELELAKTRIEVLENEREFAIVNLLTAFSLGSRDGVKMKDAIAIAIPEVKERYKASKK